MSYLDEYIAASKDTGIHGAAARAAMATAEANTPPIPKTLKRGVQFRHNIWLEGDAQTPMLCVVTAVREGLVYWRPVNGNGLGYTQQDYKGRKRAKDSFLLSRSARYVKTIL